MVRIIRLPEKANGGDNFKVAKELAEKLGLKVDMNPEKEPVAPLGSMFWVRTKALKGYLITAGNTPTFRRNRLKQMQRCFMPLKESIRSVYRMRDIMQAGSWRTAMPESS